MAGGLYDTLRRAILRKIVSSHNNLERSYKVIISSTAT